LYFSTHITPLVAIFGESRTATSSFFTERIKQAEAMELVSPPLGKPSMTVPPLRLTFFIVRISVSCGGNCQRDNSR
jgi:hypothetical protein